MGPGLRSMIHHLASMLSSLMIAIMAKNQKITFQVDSRAHFSVLSFSPGPQSNDKVIIQGKSGQFTWPLACSWGDLLFCHPFLIFPKTPVTAGVGFTFSTKSSNSPPPRQLSLLPPPSETNRSHSVNWWDECKTSLDGPLYSNKTKKFLTVSTPKTISPQAWGMIRPYAYHKFLKKQGLLISYFSPYNKLKILIKFNSKIQWSK
jgi:hypothetical protein